MERYIFMISLLDCQSLFQCWLLSIWIITQDRAMDLQVSEQCALKQRRILKAQPFVNEDPTDVTNALVRLRKFIGRVQFLITNDVEKQLSHVR